MTGLAAALRLTARLNYQGLAAAVAAVVACTYGGIVGMAALYPTDADRASYAATTLTLKASQALQGPPTGLLNLGGIAVFEVGWYLALAVALLNIMLVVRATRGQEALGRLELLRSGRFGVLANPAAVVLTALAVNAVLGVGVAAALVAGGAQSGGAASFGVVTAVIGTMFAAIALVAAQLTEHARGAYGVALGALGAAYILRALGDASDSDVVRHASPLGLAQAVRPFGDEQWWPLIPCTAIVAVGLGVAMWIETVRDHGAGLIRPALGAARAGRLLRTPFGLLARSQRTTLAIWTATLAVLGLGFGITARDVGSIAQGPSGMRKLLEEFNSDAVDGFLAVSTLLLALAAAGAAIALTLTLRSEELSGRADLVLAGTVPRRRLPMLHIALAALAGLWLLLVIGATIGTSHAFGSGDGGQVPRLVGAALGQLPAVVFFIGLTVGVIGVLPRFSWLAWVILAESAIITILGPPMNLPTPVMNLSVFHHVPRLPGISVDATPSLILLVAGIALATVGVLGFSRRDLA